MHVIELTIEPQFIYDNDYIRIKLLKELKLPEDSQIEYSVVRKSIDCRYEIPKYKLKIEINNQKPLSDLIIKKYSFINNKKNVLIIGAGPAGYFAALELIELGLKPIILERGKDVDSRRQDIDKLLTKGIINQNSNYCFGEGGAGTYSDGKLYTRSTKRGDIFKVLKLLVEHKASYDIMIDANPHIGSDKLPEIVKNIRKTIINYGGEVYFNAFVTDFIIKKDKITGVSLSDGREFFSDSVILAVGHSARNIFELLYEKQILIESKPFALGVRVEHSQSLIDSIIYHHTPKHKNLPAANYRLACQIDKRGVFSFCMCPGGYIVPTSTHEGELVVNGMSLSDRNSPYANSGIVVEVRPEDISLHKNPIDLLLFQKKIENIAFKTGGNNLFAPAQRMVDFTKGRISASMPECSYLPGIESAPVHELLPDFISNSLKKAFIEFGKKLKGYYTNEATILAVESRTSSPVRIPRDNISFMHPQLNGLYPCGEGAGYAGGIVSSAMDGQKVARKIFERCN